MKKVVITTASLTVLLAPSPAVGQENVFGQLERRWAVGPTCKEILDLGPDNADHYIGTAAFGFVAGVLMFTDDLQPDRRAMVLLLS
ncbi:MAG: hypothetical protein ACREX3_14030, partial [Gammaproteobacteria bacterium]